MRRNKELDNEYYAYMKQDPKFKGMSNEQVDDAMREFDTKVARIGDKINNDREDYMDKYVQDHGNEVTEFGIDLSSTQRTKMEDDWATTLTVSKMPHEIQISNYQDGSAKFINPRSTGEEMAEAEGLMQYLDTLEGKDVHDVTVVVKGKQPYTRGAHTIEEVKTINGVEYPAGTSFVIDTPLTEETGSAFIEGTNMSYYNAFKRDENFSNSIDDNLGEASINPVHNVEMLGDSRFTGTKVDEYFNPGFVSKETRTTIDPMGNSTEVTSEFRIDAAHSDTYNSKSKGLYLVGSSTDSNDRHVKPITWNSIKVADTPGHKKAETYKLSMLANAVVNGAYDKKNKKTGETINADGKDDIAAFYKLYRRAVDNGDEAATVAYGKKLNDRLSNYKNLEVRWVGTGTLAGLRKYKDYFKLTN